MQSGSISKGKTLVSQQIRSLITTHRKILIKSGDLVRSTHNGWFVDESLESRVQPSSFEPRLGDEIFVLDRDRIGTFRPSSSETVWDALLRIPASQRRRHDIGASGFELKRGLTYLVPLEDQVVADTFSVKSSPKSSIGRLFPRTRLVADYSTHYDEIHQGVSSDPLKLWLMIQPQPFDLIVRPGNVLNQLRFIEGDDARLSQAELRAEYARNPLLYTRGKNGDSSPVHNVQITEEGLLMELDLSGEHTNGVVALRARAAHDPIDLSQIGVYDPEHFFEPILPVDGRIRLESGRHYLLASRGVLKIPAHLNAELNRHSGVIRGTFDEAGFVDNGFSGDLVSEAVIDEVGGVHMSLSEAQPFSHLRFYRCIKSDKLYGKEIGSNYQGQLGPRTSKHFTHFDYGRAARDYAKLNRTVLTLDRRIVREHLDKNSFSELPSEQMDGLVKTIERQGIFHSRYDCEKDLLVVQPIPYGIIFDQEGNVFSYKRADSIRDCGDARLFGKRSIGVGGHITRSDAPHYVMNSLARELREELTLSKVIVEPQLVGTLYDPKTDVDQFHLGLIYALKVDGPVSFKESSGRGLGMRPQHIVSAESGYETWSAALLPYLSRIYERISS